MIAAMAERDKRLTVLKGYRSGGMVVWWRWHFVSNFQGFVKIKMKMGD